MDYRRGKRGETCYSAAFNSVLILFASITTQKHGHIYAQEVLLHPVVVAHAGMSDGMSVCRYGQVLCEDVYMYCDTQSLILDTKRQEGTIPPQ